MPATRAGKGSVGRTDEDVEIKVLAFELDLVLWGGVECCFGATDLITAPDVIGSPEGVKIGGGCVETAVGML